MASRPSNKTRKKKKNDDKKKKKKIGNPIWGFAAGGMMAYVGFLNLFGRVRFDFLYFLVAVYLLITGFLVIIRETFRQNSKSVLRAVPRWLGSLMQAMDGDYSYGLFLTVVSPFLFCFGALGKAAFLIAWTRGVSLMNGPGGFAKLFVGNGKRRRSFASRFRKSNRGRRRRGNSTSSSEEFSDESESSRSGSESSRSSESETGSESEFSDSQSESERSMSGTESESDSSIPQRGQRKNTKGGRGSSVYNRRTSKQSMHSKRNGHRSQQVSESELSESQSESEEDKVSDSDGPPQRGRHRIGVSRKTNKGARKIGGRVKKGRNADDSEGTFDDGSEEEEEVDESMNEESEMSDGELIEYQSEREDSEDEPDEEEEEELSSEGEIEEEEVHSRKKGKGGVSSIGMRRRVRAGR